MRTSNLPSSIKHLFNDRANIPQIHSIYVKSCLELARDYAKGHTLSPILHERLLHEGSDREYDIIAAARPTDKLILPFLQLRNKIAVKDHSLLL
ncbi:hypothetical protein NEF87_000152 [Candidatus Lokiarchaeum ossiferum]|uniref:Uncharacterized protein n=1 Tax=Candidatus Lokiarchaeum ossiferum TaxID=2951803 RepID=A0ABY6HN91_9ARCH|nr:hypothetical protein NEF87_000152 [Candidatus Lokiarchaeum sp. B-35]